MKKLSPDWFVEPAIDFELKSYLLLAWLNELEAELQNKKYFPLSDEITAQINNLEHFNDEKLQLNDLFKTRVSGIDQQEWKLIFENDFIEEPVLNELDRIVKWSLKKLKKQKEKVDQLIHQALDEFQIVPIGLVPLYQKEGYLFLPLKNKITVYEFCFHEIYSTSSSNYFYTQTEMIGDYDWAWHKTYEDLKIDLCKQHNKFSLPATFLCEYKEELPLEESLLPLAKKRLSTYLQQSA